MENKKKFASFSPTVRRVISQRVFFSAILAVLCVILANTLAIRNTTKIAFAESANHNLSPLTKKVLTSLTNEIRVVVLFDKQSDLFDPVKTHRSLAESAVSQLSQSKLAALVLYGQPPGPATNRPF